jgi:quercetin dioxygenase-like cupin family protein
MIRVPEFTMLAEPAGSARALRDRVIRYADLVPLTAAAERPFSSAPARQIFAIIAAGRENGAPGFLHISEPHGFAVNGVRHPAGCQTLRESYDGAQVFIVHAGHWQFQLGLAGELGSVALGPGDVASVPAGVCRSMQQQSDDGGFVLVISGHADAARSAVVGVATGTWIDVSSGVPQLKESAPAEDDRLHGDPSDWVIRAAMPLSNELSALHGAGINEAGLIGARPTRDGFQAHSASISWPHGFSLRRLMLNSGAYVPLHSRSESEVLFVQSGALEVSSPDGMVMIAAGDTMSIPAQLPRAFRNTSSQLAALFVIHGSEDPSAPQFLSTPVHISAV